MDRCETLFGFRTSLFVLVAASVVSTLNFQLHDPLSWVLGGVMAILALQQVYRLDRHYRRTSPRLGEPNN